MPHRMVHISVTDFGDSRGSVTSFDCFRLLILARPNSEYEDWPEANWRTADAKDTAGLGRVWL